ncbi:MAG: DUF423 domain-containing protein [Myxococcota bacterium]|nr:DUF423 domain-containing protein [Myxococcota bacterium]
MIKLFVTIASVSGLLAVVLGAFGAHGLKARVTPERLDVWQTAAHYHLVHSVALLALCGLLAAYPSSTLTRAGWAFIVGILIFAGSLYTLVLTDIAILGAITPIGGLSFMVGWACCAWFGWSELGS